MGNDARLPALPDGWMDVVCVDSWEDVDGWTRSTWPGSSTVRVVPEERVGVCSKRKWKGEGLESSLGQAMLEQEEVKGKSGRDQKQEEEKGAYGPKV
jgi:hypothetical protein